LEVEAKFRIPDEQTFQQLLEVISLAGFRLGDGTTTELYDRYLDTASGSFFAGGYACRIRRQNGRTLATLKGLGGASGAIHHRAETEVELPEPLPPRDWPPGPARELALSLHADEPLIPLFDLRETRTSRLLYDGDRAVAELSLDRVYMLKAESPVATYLELEAELLADGRAEDLSRLVTELQEEWGLRPEPHSKFERALFLHRGEETQRLTPQERVEVERLLQEREVFARRARLLQAWDEGLSPAEIAARARLSPRRARYWLSAFRRRRLGIFPDSVLLPKPAVEREALPQRVVAEVQEIEVTQPPAPSIRLLSKPGIKADDLMSEAGRKTFRFHYRRMLYNEPGTRAGDDIEALHDMRVATRRMRAAFRTFGDYFDPKLMRPLLKGLRRTGRMLGAVRDLDVFRAKTQAYLESLPDSQRSSLDDFLVLLEEQREAARRQMIAYLDSARYARFREAFGEFVETKGMGSLPMTPGEGGPQPYRVRHVVPVAVYQQLAAVRAYDEWVNVPRPQTVQLHALRIACKGLRYTLEFFSEVLGPSAKTLISEVVAVQDHLGNLQDAVVASGLLRDYLVWGTWGPGGKRPPMGLASPVIAPGVAAYLAVRQLELQCLLDTFPQAWQQLNNAQCSQLVAEAVSTL
jgi:CHAD domain-containing protein